MSDRLSRSRRARMGATRPLVLGGLLGLATLLLVGATAWAYTSPWAGWTPAGGTMGHISFGGQLKGSKALPKGWSPPHEKIVSSTCRFTSNGPTSLQFWLYNDKLSVKGHQRKVDDILISLNVQRDGDTETMAPTGTAGSANTYEATANLTAGIGRTRYSWTSDSGTVTTNRTGKVGSMTAGLPPAGQGESGAATKDISLKMSWSSCKPLRQAVS
jgi:hypothetical protein